MKIWSCKIGQTPEFPFGADGPMREAVREAYLKLIGKEPDFIFSGWGDSLDKDEQEVVDRLKK